MNKTSNTLIAATLCALASATFAADDMKKADPMMKKDMTMEECKDHMAMSKKDDMKKDDAMMKKDSMCADMMKKHDAMMKKDDPMMKKDDAMKK